MCGSQKCVGRKQSSVARSLQVEQFGVSAANGHQVRMATLLCNAPVREHNNSVRHPDSRKTMRNQKRHLAFGQFGKLSEYLVLRAGVECGCRFIEHEQLRIPQVRSS